MPEEIFDFEEYFDFGESTPIPSLAEDEEEGFDFSSLAGVESPTSISALASARLKNLQPEPLKGLRGFLETPKEQPTGVLSKLFDATERIRYAVAKYQTMNVDDAKSTLGRALQFASSQSMLPAKLALAALGDPRENEKITEALSEFIQPVERKGFEDVFAAVSPEIADKFPTTTAVLGFIANQPYNPLSYVTIGPKTSAARIIEKAGEEFFISPKGAVKMTELADDFIKNAERYGREHDVKSIAELSKKYLSLPTAEKEQLGGFAPKLANFLEAFDQEATERATRNLVYTGDRFKVISEKVIPRDPRIIPQALEFDKLDDAIEYSKKLVTESFKTEIKNKPWESLIKNIKDELDLPGARGRLEHLKVPTPKPFNAEAASEDAMISFIRAGREEFVQKGGVYLAGLNVIPEKMARLTGIPQTMDAIGELAKIAGKKTGISPILNRWFELPKEVTNQFKTFLARSGRHYEDTKRLGRHIAGEISKEKSLATNRVGQNIMDLTTERYEELIKNGVRHSEAMATIKDEAPQIAERELDRFFAKSPDNGKEERALYAAVRSQWERNGKETKAVKVLRNMWVNYWPAVFDMAKDPAAIIRLQRSPVRGRFVSAAQAKMIKTFEEARRMGIDTDISVIELLANRTYEARMAVDERLFRGSLKQIFGVDTMRQLELKAPRVAKQLQFMGEGDYGRGLATEAEHALKMYDKILNAFRFTATVLKPAFAFKQAVSNTLQAVSAAGFDALKMFNPKTVYDTSLMLAYHQGLLSEQGTKAMLDREMVTSLGIRKTWAKWYDELLDNGIVTGTDLRGGGQMATTQRVQHAVAAELDREMRIRSFAGNSPKRNQLKQMFVTLGNYTNYPSMVEDFFRASLYLNARRGSYSEIAARELTTAAFFDYKNGLSQTARRWVRRIYPFFSYQNFVMPLIKNTFLYRPGVAFNIHKAGERFVEAWNLYNGGERLPEEVRTALPGWLFDKPFVYYDKYRKATFGNLRSYNPLDMVEGLQLNDDGTYDVEGTLRRTFLGSTAPMLKMTVAALANYDFFRDRKVIEEATGEGLKEYGGATVPTTEEFIGTKQVKKKKIGEVTPDGILGNIMAALGAASGPGGFKIPVTLLGKAAGEVAPAEAIEWFKSISGWEERWNSETGRTDVYVNPYLLWYATEAVPILNSVIKFDRQFDTPKEKWFDLIGGFGTIKRDLRKDIKSHEERERRTLTQQRRQLMRGGLDPESAEYEKQRQLLDDYLQLIKDKYGGIDYSQIPTPLRPDAVPDEEIFEFK